MADPLASVEKIVKVALAIKEAVKTVRKNKEQCHEIRKRVLRVSALLKRLQETEMIQDPAMCDALEAIEETLTRGHGLIVACQKKNIMCRFLHGWGPGQAAARSKAGHLRSNGGRDLRCQCQCHIYLDKYSICGLLSALSGTTSHLHTA